MTWTIDLNKKTCHPTFTDKKVSQPTFPQVSLTKMVQWPIINNSHAYPFCKTMPGTQLFSIGHCTIFCQWNSLKTVAELLSQWKSVCTITERKPKILNRSLNAKKLRIKIKYCFTKQFIFLLNGEVIWQASHSFWLKSSMDQISVTNLIKALQS